jgi:predicted CoA-binding protein
MSEIVAIIGASEKPHRYANKALHSLLQHGHTVHLVNPYKTEIEKSPCYATITDVPEKVDTVTLYVNPTRFHDHIDEIIKAKPARVIFNPGTEDPEAETMLEEAGITVLRACTLVLLSIGKF